MSPFEMHQLMQIFAASPTDADDVPLVGVISLLVLFAVVLVLAVRA